MTDPVVTALSHLDAITVGVGDVLLTRSAPSKRRWDLGRLIRLGAAAEDLPNLVNHVAVVHHADAAGTLWVLEGRPGGVGWKDARRYLRDPYTIVNSGQPKTPTQRQQIAAAMSALLGTPYDWAGIVSDGIQAVGLDVGPMLRKVDPLWRQDWNGQGPPAHVVCSSAADWAYEHVGLPSPELHRTRFTTPADWHEFLIRNRWDARP